MKIDTYDILAPLVSTGGTHFLDSGGARGRHWQRTKDGAESAGLSVADYLRKRPTGSLDIWTRAGHSAEIVPTVDTIHWLSERYGPAPEIQEEYEQWAADREDSSHFEDVATWIQIQYDAGRIEDPIDRSRCPQIINSYNSEYVISQVIQGAMFDTEDASYAIVQIHNGADVRGGYSSPIILEASRDYEWALYDFDSATVACSECGAYWDYRGGYWEHSEHGDLSELVTEQWKGKEDEHSSDGPHVCPACSKGLLEVYS